MDKITKKLIDLLKEGDCVDITIGTEGIPGLKGAIFDFFYIKDHKITDFKKFKKFMYDEMFPRKELIKIRQNIGIDGDIFRHEIEPYQNKIYCGLHGGLTEFKCTDTKCKACIFYSGENKCLARQYDETAKGD